MKNWMEKNLGRRLLAMVLCLSMVLSMAPVPSFAEGCTHHPEHTADCGYVAAVQGQPCGHTHTDACYTFQTVCLHSDHGDCGYVAPVEEISCACQPNENGEMVHTEGCGYVPAVAGVDCGHVCSVESGCVTKTLNCTHQHDETCGYVQGVEGSSCTFVCQECSQLQETEPPATPVCSCETKCAEGNATESCQVCAVNIEGCTGKEPEAPVPETCAHGNALGSCETCASEARVAAVQAQIDALPGEVTAETKEAAQTALAAVDTAKAALTEAEQGRLDMNKYTALAEKLAALDKCAHGNDPATCEACKSEARVAEVQALIDALPTVEELVEDTLAQTREQLATVKAAVEALTAEEQALLTLDKYTALTEYFAALDEAATEPTETEPEPIVVTDWLWDYDEYIDEASGCMVLPITPEEFAIYLSDEETYQVIQAMLPGAVLFGEEELTLGEWTYEPAPEGTPAVEIEGVTYQPEGFFKTTLPDGYVLENETNALSLTLVLIPPVDEENTPVVYNTATEVPYRTCDSNGQNWQDLICASATIVTSGDTKWSTGWYVVKDTVTIGTAGAPQRVTVSGNVHLILANGSSLTVYGGIGVNSGNSLTIYSQSAVETEMGTLTVPSPGVEVDNAGIGGTNASGGSITINGGKVTATGYSSGAGIGGGTGSSCGTVTINGGVVTASSSFAAGIGGGGANFDSSGNVDGGNITINGGTVFATSYTQGAGIGGGPSFSGGNITISGGNVTANGCYQGAGIGGGYGGSGGNITISGGNVTANGTNGGAGIGGGYGGHDGSFSTGENGSPVIYTSSISDRSQQDQWNGIIFEGNNGVVYGDQTLSADLTIARGQTLIVLENTTLTIPKGVTLTNNGIIVNIGTINGTVTGNQPKVAVTYKDPTNTTGVDPSAICTIITADYLSKNNNTLSEGWYVVQASNDGLTIDSRIAVSVNVHLILANGCNFTVNGGIGVNSGNSLTIYSQSAVETEMGTLTVPGSDVEVDNAGIGGTGWGSSGTITINGGNVTAKGGNHGAGIGGGDHGTGGTITINGGNVTATGGEWAAGIGGGDHGSGGVITITGGTVKAFGGVVGAGIGSGREGSGGKITISGGTVKAEGGERAAGIGGGREGSGGKITISGGTVNATGNNGGAGIGGGYEGSGGSITISGGTVNATGGELAAGIGPGRDNSDGTVIIDGGTVLSVGGQSAYKAMPTLKAGLKVSAGGSEEELTGVEYANLKNTTYTKNKAVKTEACSVHETGTAVYKDAEHHVPNCKWCDAEFEEAHGFDENGNCVCGAVTVYYLDEKGTEKTAFCNAEITAEYLTEKGNTLSGGWYVVRASENGLTIESRVNVSGDVKLILADGCNFTVNGGIGVNEGNSLTIYAQSKGSTMGKLTAQNVANNYAGIGGNNASGGIITINGGEVTATGGKYGAGIGGGNKGSGGSITINGGNVTAKGGDQGAGIGGGYSASGGSITITGGTVSATPGYGASGIGHGYNGTGGNVVISGGNVTTGMSYGPGIGGSFSTGTNGSAVISTHSISDKSNENQWSGIVFINGNGTVYGNPTLTEDVTIENGQTLTVPKNTTLTINDGVTVYNNGTIVNNGTINGTVTGNQPKVTVTYKDPTITTSDDPSAICTIITADYLSKNSYTLSADWYVVQGEVTIGDASNVQRITVNGDVHLILADGCDFTVNGGIQVKDYDHNINNGSANSLTIYAQSTGEDMGKLTAQNVAEKNAGIGGGDNGSVNTTGGTIIINGGTVEATGGSQAAGIGGSDGGSGGNITINGGTVKATGGDYGAGIGGGDRGSGGNITINGGNVNATGKNGGAGIGGGDHGTGGSITINGGIVTARGNYGAGIGGGNLRTGGSITISGGNVTANGTNGGAGIGNGSSAGGGTNTFSTNGGNPVIFASSISDQSGKTGNSWHGIIFEGNDGQVYGNQTPTQSFEIPANKNLLIPAGASLDISGITVTNKGKVYMNGGTVSGAFANTENGGVYYPLTLTGCTANGVTYQEKTYAKAGGAVTLTATPDKGKVFSSWQSDVSIEDSRFTMPEKPVSVTAEFADIVASVTDGENTFNFASLQEAFNAANGNTATITLLKDVEISETLEITGGNVTFQSAVKPNETETTTYYSITKTGNENAITVREGTLNVSSGTINGEIETTAYGNLNIVDGRIQEVAATLGGKLNIQGGFIESLFVNGSQLQLNAGTFRKIEWVQGTVNQLLASGFAYKLSNGTWVDQTHGNGNVSSLDAGTGTIQVLRIPVSITTQPGNTTLAYGENKALSVTVSVATEGQTVYYQWYQDGAVLNGETGSSISLSNLNAGEYQFHCRLTCNGYELDSDTVTVTVNKANNSWTTKPAITGWTYGETASITKGSAKFGTVTVEYKVKDADDTTYNGTVPTNAGSYTARFTVAGTDNYSGLLEVKDFTISPKEITVTITPNGGTYGGTITGATAEINERLVGNDQVPVTLTYTGTDYNSTTAPTKAGTYTVTATIDNPNYSLAETTATFEIGKATVTTPTVESKAYTGKPQTAVVPESDRYTVISNLGGTDAGNYDVVLTLTDSDNYQWDSAGGKTTFRITQAENSWTEKPAIEGWTYGDDPSTPVGEAQFGTVKVEYSASADNYKEAVPTDAGSYKARFTVAETKNYKGLSEVRSFSIAQRQLTIIWSEETTFTYNGEEQYPTASAGNVAKGDNVTLNISGGTDVGSYTAICKSFTQTGAESTRGNYMGPTEDLEKSFSITAKPLTVKVQVADKQYDGKNTAAFDGTPTLEGVVGKDDVKLVNGTPTFTSVAVATGISIEFTDFSITGTASRNYTLTQPTGIKANITSRPISDADITVKLDTSSFVYDGMEKSPSVTVEYGTTTLVENTDYTLSGNTATNAGSYTLTITGMGNYSSTNVVGWKITKAPITPVVNIADVVYGETLNPSVSGNPGNGEVTYTYYSDAACKTKVTPKNVGTYYVKAAVAETVNYQSGTSEAVSFQITKKALTVTAKDKTITYGDAPANDGVAYDGFVSGETETVLGGTLAYDYSYSRYDNVGDYTITPKGLTSGNYDITFADGTLTVEQKEIGIDWGNTSLAYTGIAQAPTATATGLVNNDVCAITVTGQKTEAGNYTATAAALSNSNYKLPQSVTTTFSIAKVAPAFTAPTAKELTYSGQAQALVNAGSTGHGTMQYRLGTDGQWSTAVPTSTNAGSYTVWYKVQGDANHLDSEPVSVSCSIAKASLTVTAKDKTITYGDAPANDGVAYDGFVNGETETVLGGNLAYDYSYSQYGNVGDYTITPKGLISGNYNITFEDGKLTVEQKEIGISWGDTTFTYSGSAQKPDATATEVVNGDQLTLTVSGQQTNVGTSYTATVTDITGEKADNYKLPTSGLSTQFSITAKPLTVNVRVADKQYDGKNTAAFGGTPTLEGVVGNDDVTLVNGTPTFTSVAVATGISIAFTDFSITGTASRNYTLTQPTDVTASIYNRYTALEGTDFTSNTGSANANGWMNQALVIRAGEDFQISATNTAEGEWTDKLTVDQDGEGNLTFYVRNTQTSAISQAVTVPYKLDTTKPSAEIKFGTDAVTEKGDPKTLYLSSTIQVTITGTDGTSDIGSVSHCLSAEELNDSQLERAAWVSSSSFQVEAVDNASYRVYTKVVDNAGNVAYFRSNRFIFDTTAPSITGVEDGKTYYTTQTVKVTDTNLVSLTLNGAAATSPITLEGNMDATHIIEATDKAGNTTTYTVYMKTLDSLVAEDVEDVDASNVSKDNKENLEKAKEDLEDQLASATEAEQDTINELLDPINEALAALKNVEAVEAVIKNLPDSIQIDDEDPTDENAIKAARAAYEALTDHEKTLADISKLTKLESDLVAYGIISGDGSVWNMGSGEDQVFTANGPVRKFQKVELDNEKLDEANYQVTMGSTIVTLNAAFMQTLEEGSHTLAVFYTDGQTKEAKFEVKRSQNYLDLTEEPAFQGRTEVFVDGVSYPIEENGNSYVNLPETGDLLTLYTYRTGAGDYGDYPTGMEVYRINRSAGGTTVTHIPELSNLLQYSGCSIRVTGNRGIRMITSLDQGKKAALTGPGLAGFTLEEYGTVVTWASDLGEGDLNLNSGKHNFAYKRGVADPVFGTNGSLTQYTNVLVGFSQEECSKDIVMRPYIVLRAADGNQYTLYGGTVTRSISYIAWQNRDTYKPWTSAYDYVHELMGLYNAA